MDMINVDLLILTLIKIRKKLDIDQRSSWNN